MEVDRQGGQMQFTTVLLVAALGPAGPALSVPSQPNPIAVTSQAVDSSRTAFADQIGQIGTTPTSSSSSSTNPHTLGVGGSIVATNRGVGGSMRYWFGKLGVDLNASYYNGSGGRSTYSASTFQASPSVIYIVSNPNSTREVDVRPYLGGGISYAQTSALPPSYSPGNTTRPDTTGIGMQVFGGAEIGFKDTERLTLSVEGIYHNLPSRFAPSNSISGFNVGVALHYYLK